VIDACAHKYAPLASYLISTALAASCITQHTEGTAHTLRPPPSNQTEGRDTLCLLRNLMAMLTKKIEHPEDLPVVRLVPSPLLSVFASFFFLKQNQKQILSTWCLLREHGLFQLLGTLIISSF
jgi:hypothetical protein